MKKNTYEVPFTKFISVLGTARILSGSLSYGDFGRAGNEMMYNDYEEAF